MEELNFYDERESNSKLSFSHGTFGVERFERTVSLKGVFPVRGPIKVRVKKLKVYRLPFTLENFHPRRSDRQVTKVQDALQWTRQRKRASIGFSLGDAMEYEWQAPPSPSSTLVHSSSALFACQPCGASPDIKFCDSSDKDDPKSKKQDVKHKKVEMPNPAPSNAWPFPGQELERESVSCQISKIERNCIHANIH